LLSLLNAVRSVTVTESVRLVFLLSSSFKFCTCSVKKKPAVTDKFN
jgi:hypothetical protein